ncbi:MAG: ATP-grasp domain-containing protein [Deltaproteobacteria bacterium]|nr:ATP-grasp domain-containing protein [Deltaproteobacteria bacterium]
MRLVLLLGEREYDLGSQEALASIRSALPRARLVLVKKTTRWYRWNARALASSVEKVLNVDSSHPACVAAVLGALDGRSVDGVVAIHEDCLRSAAAIAAARGLGSPDASVVETCRDKLRLREVLSRAGIGAPASVPCTTVGQAREAAIRLGLPVVVKPRDKAGSTGVMIVEKADEVAAAFSLSQRCRWSESRSEEVLVEPYYPGPIVTINGVVWGGSFSLVATSTKKTCWHPFFLTSEDQMPAAVPQDVEAACVEAVRRGCRATGLVQGVVHAEVAVAGHGPRILEMTPRPGGGYVAPMVRAHSGVDLFALAARIAVGLPPDPPPREPARHVVGRVLRSREQGVLTDFRAPSAGEGIEAVRWTKRRGDRIGAPPGDFFAELGFVVASGRTGIEASDRLERYVGVVRAAVGERGLLGRSAVLLRRIARDERLLHGLASFLRARALPPRWS